ncbi:aminodeoxychorismate lyase [Cohnella luojiensis]|uniref:Aminodeoxychorismate lyase n=1 Tax=Cohnella luojiensis TaxID=652876 RepID=A0A4Y8LUD9_9BACL|nr:aminodeoxychorismate lyase [Cohnella luojiensis]TFE24101.1 aminodeoxychorismate lyase [Cohnella luojiensis]
MILLVNGRPTDSKEAVISALDHGFLYGMGLFETFRTYKGKPWLLDKHARRLAKGCEMLGIQYTPNLDLMQEAVTELLRANGLEDGYIRWSVSAGEGAIGLPADAYDKPNEIVYAKEQAEDDPATRKGKTVRLLQLPRSTPEGDIRLKSFHYMNNINAKRELNSAGARPGTEGLFLNHEGHVVEGMVSNVFWISDGVLYTPAASTGLLEGVTREYVLAVAAEMGIRTEQGLYAWDKLIYADEVFLTNSIQEIVPVTKVENIGGRGLSPGGCNSVGAITYNLMNKYRDAAERNESR